MEVSSMIASFVDQQTRHVVERDPFTLCVNGERVKR
jgi:hypothetical protein